MQSSWHNLPEFDPDDAAYQQQAGAEFAAAAVTVADTLDDITMDIAPAYGNVPGLTTYRRTVTLTEGALHLQDKTDYTGTVALTLMSVEKPVSDGRRVQFGTLAEAILDGASKILVEPVPITDARLRQAWPDTLYRTRVYFTGQLRLTIS